MRILQLGKFFSPHRGGIETVTEHLCQLNSDDVDVHTIVVGKPEKFSQEKHPDVRCYPENFTMFNSPFSLGYIVNAVREIKNTDIAVIHFPNPQSLIVLFAASFLFQIKSTKIIIFWHSDVIGKNRALEYVLGLCHKYWLSKSANIVVTSPTYAINSVPLEKFQEKIRVIPLGIHSIQSFFKREIEPEKIQLLAVGRLVNYKGFGYLIEALSVLPAHFNLTLVGSGPLFNVLSEMAEPFGDRLNIVTDATNEELEILYRDSDIFCLPSISKAEAFGVVLVEAMSYSLPIVSTDIPGSGVAWVNRHEESGLVVPPKDALSLANAIVKISSKKEYAKYNSGSFQRYYNDFRLEKMLDGWRKLLKELG